MNTLIESKDTAKPKRETLAVRKLKNGLHAIIIAQNKGGESKSMASLEVYLAALNSGFKTILATMDQSNKTLVTALGDENKIVSVEIGSASKLQRSLNEIFDSAEAEGAVLVLDTTPAYVDENHPMIPAMKKTRIFEGENSIAALIPMRPTPDAIRGAVDALRVMPVDFKRCLIRAWHHDPDAPGWSEFPAYAAMAEKYPVCNLGTWLQTTEDIIHKHGEFAEFPHLDALETYYQQHAFEHSRLERNAMLNTLEHFEDARLHIFKNLLEPLLEPME